MATAAAGRKLWGLLFGRPLASHEDKVQRIGTLQAVPALGLDALGSAAYGPEAALTLLIPLGAAGLRTIAPLEIVTAGLLTIVFLSYRQTIHAYPNGGGSYTVAKENLGSKFGVLAAAALSLDYVLNAAVGISAGVGALVSAFPPMNGHRLALCLGILALITVVNLRGMRESGVAFMLPTYLFAGTLLTVIGIGIAKTVLAGGHPHAVVPPPPVPAGTEALSLWLLVRAFASGCTAMTGVEAVSNAVPAFREPRVEHARRTLTIIVGILLLLLLGIGVLSHSYSVAATPPEGPGYASVLSQLTAAVVGRNSFYYVTLASVFSVLCLSANTSFADFPRLCRILADDGYLPKAFAHRGRRLAFSTGVLNLAVASGALLIAFGGVTDRLIPLFAVGAFLAFTLSQSGMVVHWRHASRRSPRAMTMNAVGACATGATLLIVVASKFTEGAWITILALPLVCGLLAFVHRHNQKVTAELAPCPLDTAPPMPPIVVVPIRAWDRVAQKGLRLAMGLSPDVHAVHLYRETRADDLCQAWPRLVCDPAKQMGRAAPPLHVLSTPYRRFYAPLLGFIRRLLEENPKRDVAVVVPEIVSRRWYHALLHSHKATVLKAVLLLKGGPRVLVIAAPWYLRDA